MISYFEFPSDLIKHAIYISVRLQYLSENISLVNLKLLNFFFSVGLFIE